MFSISFTNQSLEYPYDDLTIPAAPGTLRLGNSTEEFLANLSLWGKFDYQSHWLRELKSLFEGRLKAALVVSYNDPKAASNMEIWRVYRDREWLHFQNQLLSYSNLPDEFQISEINQHIDDRVVVTADGNRISEWDVHVRDVEMFLMLSISERIDSPPLP